MKTQVEMIREAAEFISSKTAKKPAVALMLGSGLGSLADEIEDAVRIPYAEIPHFPLSTAPGHAGLFTAGGFEGREVIVMGGRFHYYEGYEMDAIAFAVRVMRKLGVETLVLTNAAGGVNTSFVPGDLMAIVDHLNLTGQNPLRGPNDESLGLRFPDLTTLYDKGLVAALDASAAAAGFELRHGVYAWMTGPSFETPAEIRMLRVLGADAVGMSTVPEAIAARHCGMRVAGVSCISNMAAGILKQPITSEEVIEITGRVRSRFSALIRGLVSRIDSR